MKILLIKSTGEKQIVEVSSKKITLLAQPSVQYQIIDSISGKAVPKINLRRQEDDLEIQLDSCDSIIIENHFKYPYSPIVGEGSDGVLYSYIPQTDADDRLVVNSNGLTTFELPQEGTLGHHSAWVHGMYEMATSHTNLIAPSASDSEVCPSEQPQIQSSIDIPPIWGWIAAGGATAVILGETLKKSNGPTSEQFAALSVDQMTALGISGVTANNLAAVRAAILTSASNGNAVDTKAELQTLVNTINGLAVSDVTIVDGTYKIGSTVTVTITPVSDASGLTLRRATFNGHELTDITDHSDGTYTGTYTVVDGDTDVADGGQAVVSLGFTNAAGYAGVVTASTDLSGESIDAHAPTLSSSTPADNATAINPDSNLTFTFSENIVAGTGSIVLHDITADVDIIIDITDNTQVRISGKTLTINPTDDLVGVHDYAVYIDNTAIKDLAGNTYAGIANSDNTTLNFSTGPANSISLGEYGNLIKPVQVEGKWYYYWDLSGDGTAANSGTLNSGVDTVSLDWLTQTFFDAPITESNNSFEINGIQVKLPTDGITDSTSNPTAKLYPGTKASGTGTTDNATYDDLLAIWDAFNGTGTSTDTSGIPSGWSSGYYWSATPSAVDHAAVSLAKGEISDGFFVNKAYIALQVVL